MKHIKHPSRYQTSTLKCAVQGVPKVYRVVAQDHPEHDRASYVLLAQPHGHTWWHVDKLNLSL